MIQRRRPHILTYVAAYALVALLVGGALYFLRRDYLEGRRKAALAQEEREKALARQKPPPPPPPKPVAPKPVATPKPKEVPTPKPPEPMPPPKKAPEPDPMAEIEKLVESQYPLPTVRPLLEIVGNWEAVPQKAFPALVTLRAPLSFEVKRGTAVVAKGVLPTGSSVAPLELGKGILQVAPTPGSPIRVTAPVDQTDFKERIQVRYDEFVRNMQAGVMTRRAREKEKIARARALDMELSTYGKGEDPRFDPMKASIRRGEAGSFQIETADRWRWAGKETIDGEEYDVGLVMMVTESAFGTSEVELKALIRDGKLVKWLDTATGKPLVEPAASK